LRRMQVNEADIDGVRKADLPQAGSQEGALQALVIAKRYNGYRRICGTDDMAAIFELGSHG